METNAELNLAISLPLRNTNELTQAMADLYNPASPQFHQFLTPTEFTERYGPSEASYAALKNYCITHGLALQVTHSNRTLLLVKGTVDSIQKTFHTKLNRYQHANRECYAPENEPTSDFGEPILHIQGLDNFNLPRANSQRKAIAQMQNSTNGTGSIDGLYGGADFRNTYLPGVALDGAGQSIALVEFDSFYAQDITTYLNITSLRPVPLVSKVISPGTGIPGVDNGEVALDIECAIAMAPGLKSVIIYESAIANFQMYPDALLAQIAEDDSANQISCSWQWDVVDDPSVDQSLLQMAAQGQSFFTSAGDSGAYTTANHGHIDKPSDCVYATVVGGTELQVGTNAEAWGNETVWNRNNFATGGGISSDYAIPGWQIGIANSQNGGSSTYRTIPDVALIADHAFSISDNGQGGDISGTSISAPLWAGIAAIANQKAATLNKGKIGFINPSLYALGKSANAGLIYHDITNGNNCNILGTDIYYAAVPGYDLCTGWGTPTGSNFIDALVCLLTTNQIDHYTLQSPTNNPLIATSFNLTITAQSYGGLPANNFSGNLTLKASLQTTNVAYYGDFEDATFGGWSTPGTTYTASIDPTTGAGGSASSLLLSGGNETTFNGMTLPLSNCQPQHIEFSVKANVVTTNCAYFAVGNGNSQTNSLFYFHMAAEVVRYLGPNGWMPPVTNNFLGLLGFASNNFTIHNNQWYKIRVDVNWTNKTLDYFVDNELITPNVNFLNTNLTGLKEAQIFNISATSVWFDQIKFYNDPTNQPINISPNTVNCVKGVANAQVQIATGGTNIIITATDSVGNTGSTAVLTLGNAGLISATASPANAGYVGIIGAPLPGSLVSLTAQCTNKSFSFSQWSDGNTNAQRDIITPATTTNFIAEYGVATTIPVFTLQPSNVVVNAGENANFTVWGQGGSLNYAWKCTGQSNALGNQFQLILTNVAPAAGTNHYFCILSNNAGSITSKVAQIIIRPEVANLRAVPNGIEMELATTPGKICYIQASTNLTSWANIATNTTGSGDFTDTNNQSRRFYRLKLP